MRLWRSQQRFLGRLVELRGNIGFLDGLYFSLDHPAIDTRLKSHFATGAYEKSERRLAVRHVACNLPVIEGGGSIGVVSCVTNRLLHDPSKHLVVEANPALLPLLTKNRDRNGAKFSIVHAALGAEGSTVTFYMHGKSSAGSIRRETDQAVVVPAMTLMALLRKTGWKNISLLCDIEGAEIDLIRNEGTILRDFVQVFIVEMHPQISGVSSVNEALQALLYLGFVVREREEDVYVLYNDRQERNASS